jgi:hypothetical protein
MTRNTLTLTLLVLATLSSVNHAQKSNEAEKEKPRVIRVTKGDGTNGGVGMASASIPGVAVNLDGKPVSGATVATEWTLSKKNGVIPNEKSIWGGGNSAVITDKDGKFSLNAECFGQMPLTVTAISQDKNWCGFLSFIPKNDDPEIKLLLVKTKTVQFTIRTENKEPLPFELQLYLESKVGGFSASSVIDPTAGIVSKTSDKDTYNLRLPSGEYALFAHAGDSYNAFAKSITVPDEKDEVKIEDLILTRSSLAKSVGKKFPILDCKEVRGLPAELADKGAELKISDLEGKKVYIQFWGPGG